ncbi:MAG: OmpA family protein [Holophagaceae bacterium]|nr:OmpA family protein [Holophagaceae bacterium]
MASLKSWILPLSASVGLLAAGGDTGTQAPSKGWPWEVQLQLDQMSYSSADVRGPLGGFKAGADPSTGFGIRFAIDPICTSWGSILFSAGYRAPSDVTIKYGQKAPFDLKHRSQAEIGVMARFGTNEPRRRWEWGVGVDERFDSMRATGAWGTPTEDKAWRPWVRGMVRYVWDDGKNTQPFLGLEVAGALGKVEVNEQNYYQDLVVLTNTYPAGYRSRVQGPESLTRGHFPTFQVALVGGIRFGRANCGKPVAMAPVPAKEETPAPVAAVTPTPAVEPTAAPVETTQAKPVEPPPAPMIDVQSLTVHFGTNKFEANKAAAEAVKGWAEKYKSVVDPSVTSVIGHTDSRGSRKWNEVLSVKRAQNVAHMLKGNGLNLDGAKIEGHAFDEPIGDNNTKEGRALNRRTDVTFKDGSKFRVTGKTETAPDYTRTGGPRRKKAAKVADAAAPAAAEATPAPKAAKAPKAGKK